MREDVANLKTTPTDQAADDADLIRRVFTGDEEAFQMLHQRHAMAVQTLVATRFPRDVDDACQQAWLKLWQDRGRTFDGHNVRGWLFRVAKNAALDLCRQRRRVSDFHATLENDLESRPTEAGDWAEYRESLARCWHLLTPQQRRLIEARLQTSDYSAVCRELNIQMASAYKLFHAARQQLVECARRNGR